MSKLFKQSMFVIGGALLPVLAFAQVVPNQDVPGILSRIQDIFIIVIPIIMTLALLYFLWGLAHYILGAGDEEKRKAGRDMMIYGIIALFVMAAVWGLVGVLGRTVGVGTGGATPDLPEVPVVR